jgi:hypothetical protein
MHEPDGELEAEVRPPTWQDPAACWDECAHGNVEF